MDRCDELYPDALFCDGFEWTPGDGATRWSLERTVSGSLATVRSPAPRVGERALRASTTSPMGQAYVQHTFPGVMSGEVWVRGYFYVPAALPIPSDGLLVVLSLDGGAWAQAFLLLHDGGRMVLVVGGSETELEGIVTDAFVPRDAWTCVQVRIALGLPGATVGLFVDGTRLASMYVDGFRPDDQGLRNVRVGVVEALEDQGATTIYVDEVVVSRSFVHCE